MKRLFWLGVGLAAGAYVTRRASTAAHRLTPAGIGANIADGLRELGAGLGEFGAEVRVAMRDHEPEQPLHERGLRRRPERRCVAVRLLARRALIALLTP